MRPTETLLAALAVDPADDAAWLALADALEEEGRDREAQLTRLRESLRLGDGLPRSRDRRHQQLRELLAAGVRPVLPRRLLSLPDGGEMAFVLIPPGRFWMGSPTRELGRHSNEGPRHPVRLTRGFWLGETPVTRRQWWAMTENYPARRVRGELPANDMNWHECLEVCRKLGKQTGCPIRVPTEAEWEYACRATSTTPFASGTTETDADLVSWHWTGERMATPPVGQKQPNAWGLYDMHGNIWEWCLDGKRKYQKKEMEDPVWRLEEDADRSLRGGSSGNRYLDGRSACRGWARPEDRATHWGCRLAMSLDESDPVLRVLRRHEAVTPEAGRSARPRRRSG